MSTTGHVGIVHDLDRLFTLSKGTLIEAGIALLGYALLEGVEAIGLWYGKRWAEYLTFIATVVFLPFEIYELTERVSPLKVIGFADQPRGRRLSDLRQAPVRDPGRRRGRDARA